MNRLRYALHVLLGRPLMYRMNLLGGVRIGRTSQHAIVAENSVGLA